MSSKPVAVDGDTKPVTSTLHVAADTDMTGSWTLKDHSVTKGTKVSAKGKFVELMATASWTYEGGSASGNPIPPVSDSATLSAGPTILEDNGSHILVDGDQASGSTDVKNRIVVSASQQKLQTA